MKGRLVDYKDGISYFFIPGERLPHNGTSEYGYPVGEPEKCEGGFIYGLNLDWSGIAKKAKEMRDGTNR